MTKTSSSLGLGVLLVSLVSLFSGANAQEALCSGYFKDNVPTLGTAQVYIAPDGSENTVFFTAQKDLGCTPDLSASTSRDDAIKIQYFDGQTLEITIRYSSDGQIKNFLINLPKAVD